MQISACPSSRGRLHYIRWLMVGWLVDVTTNFPPSTGIAACVGIVKSLLIYRGIAASVSLVKSLVPSQSTRPPSQLVPNSQLNPPSQLVPPIPPTSFHSKNFTKYFAPTIFHRIFSTTCSPKFVQQKLSGKKFPKKCPTVQDQIFA